MVLTCRDKVVREWTESLSPGKAFTATVPLPDKASATDLNLEVSDTQSGRALVAYQPQNSGAGEVPPPATEPPAPADIKGNDELFITGLHLEQYRHATRCPTRYWLEALRRDPQDSRCNLAMGKWHFLPQ